jgi:hypothetical protein
VIKKFESGIVKLIASDPDNYVTELCPLRWKRTPCCRGGSAIETLDGDATLSPDAINETEVCPDR